MISSLKPASHQTLRMLCPQWTALCFHLWPHKWLLPCLRSRAFPFPNLKIISDEIWTSLVTPTKSLHMLCDDPQHRPPGRILWAADSETTHQQSPQLNTCWWGCLEAGALGPTAVYWQEDKRGWGSRPFLGTCEILSRYFQSYCWASKRNGTENKCSHFAHFLSSQEYRHNPFPFWTFSLHLSSSWSLTNSCKNMPFV